MSHGFVALYEPWVRCDVATGTINIEVLEILPQFMSCEGGVCWSTNVPGAELLRLFSGIVMKKSVVWLFIIGALVGIQAGCHSGANGQNDVKAEKKAESSAQAQNQKLMDEINDQYDQALIEKVRKEDRVPPRVNATLEVIKNDHISSSDVEYSWMFGKAAFERCYSVALARDENASGDVVFALDRKQGASNPEVVSFSSEIKVEKFEDCIKSSLTRWRLPEGASFEVRVKLRSLPGLTEEDFEKMTDKFR